MHVLSIIIPTFQRKEIVRRTIEKLLPQLSDEVELIVVDDGSNDGTDLLLSSIKHPSFQYIHTENQERGRARNTGVSLAKGKFINFFDSDDEPLEHHVSTILNAINKFPDKSIFRLDYFKKKTNKDNKLIKSWANQKKELIHGNSIGIGSMVIARSICNVFPFAEDRKIMVIEDYLLWIKLYAHYEVQALPVATHIHHLHSARSSILMSDPKRVKDRYNIFLETISKDPSITKYLGKRLNYLKMRLALVMAVDLAYTGNKQESIRFLKLAFKQSPLMFGQRIFYATIRHLIS